MYTYACFQAIGEQNMTNNYFYRGYACFFIVFFWWGGGYYYMRQL